MPASRYATIAERRAKRAIGTLITAAASRTRGGARRLISALCESICDPQAFARNGGSAGAFSHHYKIGMGSNRDQPIVAGRDNADRLLSKPDTGKIIQVKGMGHGA